MKILYRRLVFLLVCMCLLWANVICVGAEEKQEPGQFALAVLTADGIVIEPTYILYAQGQTIAQALLGSGYEFAGLLDDPESSGWINEIQGVPASYSLFYDENGYDLTVPADSITALCITEKADNYSAEYLDLIKTMAYYNTCDNEVETYAAAKEAYDKALTDLYTATPSRAQGLNAALKKAIEEYDQFISGEKVTLKLDVPGTKGGVLSDRFGNTYAVTEAIEYQLPPGMYDFDLNDGGRNHIRGTVEVVEDTVLTAQLPDRQWLMFMDISMVYTVNNGDLVTTWTAVDKLDEWTFAVPDYSGENLYPWFEPAEGLDTSKCAMYLGEGSRRIWKSHQTVLARVIEADSMEGEELLLEARQEYGEYVQYQTYPVSIVRVPSLSNLTVYSDGTKLPLDFSPETKEYTLMTTGSSVDLYPETLTDEGIRVEVNGNVVTSESCHIDLDGETTKLQIHVSHENGQSSIYDITVQQLDSVKVQINTPADSVQVYNAAGAEIAPVGGVYALVPGEQYTYVTTTAGYFHTSAEFTASAGLVVSAPAEEVIDALSALSVAAAYKERANPFDVEPMFSPNIHEYTFQVGSNQTDFGVMAELYPYFTENGYTMTALYDNWSTGEAREREIKPPYTACTMFLGVSGKPNTMTLRIGKEAEGVKFYQDYIMVAQRKLQLNEMSIVSNGQELVLNQVGENKTGFSKFVLDYTAQIGQTVPKVDLNLKLFSTSAGKDQDVTVRVSCAGEEFLLDYNQLEVEKIHTLSIALDVEQQEESLEITLERDGATAQTYCVTFEKLPPVETVISSVPEQALVHVSDDVSGNRVLPEEDGSFILSTGRCYSYVVTCYGYVTKAASFVAGEANSDFTVTLDLAPDNGLKDIALDTDYLYFRGNEYNNGITDALTPIRAEDAVLNWANKIGDGLSNGGVGSPIIVGGNLYTYASDSLFKIDKDTGTVLDSAPMDHASSFSITPPAYGEGMIFIALANGGIQAFNAETLDSLWIYSDPLGGQPNCPVVYRDGFIYTGFWNAEEKQANFVCINVTDEDPAQTQELKLASWRYTHNGFYWAGAYVGEDFLLVTTDDGSNGYTSTNGSILSIDTHTGFLLDELVMPNVGDVRSSVCYDEVTDAYYFTSKGGDFYSVEVDTDGKFYADTLKQLHLDNGANSEKNPPMSTSTPVVYKGRAYIGVSGTGQFVSYSGHNITVIDLANWKIAYTVPTQGYPQTSGLLTTAYEGDREYVYVYFLDNYTPGKLRVIRDTAGQNSFDISYSTCETYTKSGKTYTIDAGYVLFTPSSAQAQYAICSPIVDEYGNIYFKNDSGYLMCVGSTIEELVVEREPHKLVYEVGQVFDPSGMKITALYANGLERDMSKYAFASQDPLTVDDTEMTVTLNLGQFQKMYQNQDGEVGVEYYLPSATVDLTINTDHTWDEGAVSKNATCVEAGELRYTCPVCNAQRLEPIPATGVHSWDSGTVTLQPSCVATGEMTYTCTVCEAVNTEQLPVSGLHSWDEGTVLLEPTGVEDGEMLYRCIYCEMEKKEIIPATGEHIWDAGVVTKSPSCAETGLKVFTCSQCGLTKETVLEVTQAHSWDEGKITLEPNCIETGIKTFQCTRCEVTEDTVLALTQSHSWDAGTILRQPSVIAQGEKLFVCTLCGEKQVEAIGMTAPCDGTSCPGQGFSDWVRPGHWAHDGMDYALSKGLMNGVGEDKFDPNGELTRAMLVTILWRYAGQEDVGNSTFSDVPENSWFSRSVAWAANYGIVNGLGDNQFGPNVKITREQIATILYRYAAYLELDTSETGDFSGFADGDRVSSWAVEAMRWATATGVMAGSNENGKIYLNPGQNATRAQASKLFMSYIELILG